jgi:hypothetical protein|tara:strand:+ start:190 stop:657 length:468 start_codon:yes stop_codon:yes gene_type:complete
MRSSEFMNYISTPLTYEQMHLLYRANNIKYEKCELFHDFIKSINKIIYKTYLGEEYISNEKEMVQHFNWCVDKVLSDFGEENIIFQDTTQIKEYFYFFYEELFYKRNEDVNKLDKLDKLANLSFNYHRLKSRSDIDVLIELYKLLDKSLTKKIKK